MKYDKTCNSIKIVLIRNSSHEKNAWMFPGCHIEVSNNRFANGSVDSLKSIGIIPDKIIVNKVRDEAGLEGISLIDPNFDSIMRNKTGNNPRACWSVRAPVFNYLFMVSEYSKCYKNMNHRCHYDFTYVGEYTALGDGKNKFTTVEVEFNLDKYKFDGNERTSDISNIQTIVQDTINKSTCTDEEQYESINHLCLDSIPRMIYNAIIFYKKYKDI